MTLEIRLFGYPSIFLDGEPLELRSGKTSALFAYLSLYTEPQNRKVVGDILWSNTDDARSNLRRLLYNLKSTELDPYIHVTPGTLQLDPEMQIYVDVLDFSARVNFEEGQTPATDDLLAAVDLYEDDFLAGFSLDDAPKFDEWVVLQRKRLKALYVRALETLAAAAQDAGDIQETILLSQRLVEADPLHEAFHRQLIRLYAQRKQPERAMEQYHKLVHLLRDELGVDPQPATVKLYDDLLEMEIRPEDTDPLLQSKAHSIDLYPPMPQNLLTQSQQLTELHTNLLSREVTSVVLLGHPGSGKSALAASIVNNPDIRVVCPDGILWATLGAEPDLTALLSLWCEVLGITPSSSLDSVRMQLNAAIDQKRMLLVIDDVWQEADALPFRLASSRSRLMVTTRFPGVARALAEPSTGFVHRTQGLSEADCLQLLRQHSAPAVDHHHDELVRLMPRLGGLPLAVNHFGQLMAEEWEYGISQDLLGDVQDTRFLLTSDTFIDPLASPLDRGQSIQRRYHRMLTPELIAEGGKLLRVARDAILQNEPLDSAYLQRIWGDDFRDAVRAFIDSGILYPLGNQTFTSHPMWLEVLAM